MTTVTKHRRISSILFCLFCLLGAADAIAGEPAGPRYIPSPEPGWPQWRGPRRDGICLEKGLLRSWPEGGPRTIWTAGGLGSGYSSPIIAGGRIYITGEVGDDLAIFALDLEGKPLWTSKNGRAWKGPYPGARACCAFRDGRLFHMNGNGRAACLDPATGREIWAVEVLERFGGKPPTWGVGECLLVDGSRVIVSPGGTKAALAALDARTGETLWASAPVRLGDADGEDRPPEGEPEIDGTAYASPILLEFAGRRLVAGCSSRHLLLVDAETGSILWKRAMVTTYEVLALTPVIYGDGIFMTAPDSKGGKLFRLLAAGSGVSAEEVWTADMDTCHGGVLPGDGFLLGSWYRRYNGWGCVDARTGKTLHRTRDMVMGSAISADGRFYCLAQDGTMALVEADAKAFRIVSRFRLGDARGKDAWAHPVILDGRLYLRFQDRLQCHDIRERPGTARS